MEFPVATKTQHEQWTVENLVFRKYNLFEDLPHHAQTLMLELRRDEHIEYLMRGLRGLPASFSVLDANSRPWMCYWILHSLALLGELVDDELENNTIDFLSRCQDPNGGYGGGPGQMPHLATTYAAVNSLITLGGHKALSSINRRELYTFLRRMKQPSGGFRMHDAGEIDVRACYTAISVASVLNILDHELVDNVGSYILSCQTYEGGISGEPGSEAHGGYTFCGLATMILINEVNCLDLPRLIDWLVFRQGKECGFQGRTNKLVDGCYSFWQGGAFALLQRIPSVSEEQIVLPDVGHCTLDTSHTSTTSRISEVGNSSEGTSSQVDDTGGFRQEGLKVPFPVNYNDIGYDFINRSVEMKPLFHAIALQRYILLCTQAENGGLIDKPGKSRDFYHTCYCLSGLSICQHICSDADSPVLPRAVSGPYSNLLEPIHPLFNVVLDQYHEAREFFTTHRAPFNSEVLH
ncbi:protein farnesyltransferase subunit beta isoform X1 [Rosa chinensis]|uniref:protein farnesyltransferase subunit beta isoform X1 n=1 Tax=Rosa chinensis TaxID=74649 RepID=UPI000D091554|nr:protein farnesyltransferase subunit beta isoform X1 [Rosa chinensis]